MNNTPVFLLEHITKSYRQGRGTLDVIKDASLEIHKGEIVALVGPSGSGKSTLLQIAGLLDNADSGEVVINHMNCSRLNDKERTRMRREAIGFVYQFHHLLPEFTACENVAVPQVIAGKKPKEAKEKATQLLERLGLKERVKHFPSQLSGGEQQRVAIARALANNPALLLADEPTGNLDPTTAGKVFDVLLETARDMGQAALIVTHNYDLAKYMDRVVTLKEGVLVEE